MILNRAKDYYENDKERLKKQARDKYKNLSEEETNKKKRIWEELPQYVWRKEEKNKRISNYREAKKSQNNNEKDNFLIAI